MNDTVPQTATIIATAGVITINALATILSISGQGTAGVKNTRMRSDISPVLCP